MFPISAIQNRPEVLNCVPISILNITLALTARKLATEVFVFVLFVTVTVLR